MDVLRTPESSFAAITDYPWEPRYVELADGLRMAYVDAGPADAHRDRAALLHGEPMWGYLYRTMIGPLIDAGCRVVVPDLIGFGRSDKPFDPVASRTASRRLGERLVTALDLRHVTFFGQDWGGLLGSRVVADLEDHFARLVFSNTALPMLGPGLPNLGRRHASLPRCSRRCSAWTGAPPSPPTIASTRTGARAGRAGPPFYFLVWRVYSQEVHELGPSKVVPGLCSSRSPRRARCLRRSVPDAGVHGRRTSLPMLAPVTFDDPEGD